MGILSNPLRKLRDLWVLAKSERATPKQIGWAVGVGCFVGCSPALGFHGGIALAAATLFRLNRLFCWLGSRSSNIFVIPFLAAAQVEIAHRLRTGEWVVLDHEHLLDQATSFLLDWILGMIPVGLPASLLLGFLAFFLARRSARRRKAEVDDYKQGPGVQLQ